MTTMSPKQIKQILDDLAPAYGEQINQGGANELFDASGNFVHWMDKLGVHSYDGYSRAMANSLRSYTGRIGFYREVTERTFSFFRNQGLNTDITDLPKSKSLTINLRLLSLDISKVLVCTIREDEEGVYAYVTVHRHAREDQSGARWFCNECENVYCTQRRSTSLYHEEINQALDQGSLKLIWYYLDLIWVELMARRPYTKPLTAKSLWVRYITHQDRPVTVVTEGGKRLTGMIGRNLVDPSDTISRILLLTNSGAMELLPEQVYEILPRRIDLE